MEKWLKMHIESLEEAKKELEKDMPYPTSIFHKLSKKVRIQ